MWCVCSVCARACVSACNHASTNAFNHRNRARINLSMYVHTHGHETRKVCSVIRNSSVCQDEFELSPGRRRFGRRSKE